MYMYHTNNSNKVVLVRRFLLKSQSLYGPTSQKRFKSNPLLKDADSMKPQSIAWARIHIGGLNLTHGLNLQLHLTHGLKLAQIKWTLPCTRLILDLWLCRT